MKAIEKIRGFFQAACDYVKIGLEYVREGIAFLARWRGVCLLIALVILYTSGVCVIHKAIITPKIRAEAELDYQEQLQAYKDGEAEKAEQEAARIRAEAENAENVRKRLAEALAIAMYAFRDNSETDIITACWCFFNRVDIQTGEYAYLKTLEEVIAQPGQWMDYSPDHPVLEKLYRIAYEQLSIWLDGGHRPVSVEYVFLVWSPKEIYLIDSLTAKNPRTWRYRG